jgi:hypothetical protein
MKNKYNHLDCVQQFIHMVIKNTVLHCRLHYS